MNTLNWLCSRALPAGQDHGSSAQASPVQQRQIAGANQPTYDDISDRFAALHTELAQAKAGVLKARQEVYLTKTELSKTNNQVASLKAKNGNQQGQLTALQNRLGQTNKAAAAANRTVNSLQAENKRLIALVENLRRENSSLAGAKTLAQQRQAANEQLLKDQYELTAKYDALRKTQGEALFELERIKCVEQPTLELNALPLIPQPFAVVLIDADAYCWNTSLFTSTEAQSGNAGALAANKIQRAVEAHLAGLSVSPFTRVVARAFMNDSGSAARRILKTTSRSMSIFRRQFTEALPLFDFFDCGSGKERADYKIKDNFQLYLSNPSCQHIFLATCTDNGFARMLEPYRYHEVKNKITLVSQGYMLREIEVLGFETIEWPDIFSRRLAPPEIRAKTARRQEEAARDAAHNTSLGMDGSRIRWVSDFVMDIVEDALEGSLILRSTRSLPRYSANVGLRSLQCRAARAELEVLIDDFEDAEDDTSVD